MPRSVNKVILIGNLGNDPTTNTSTGGTVVCHISLATNDTWKDKQTGKKTDRVEWHKVVFFNKMAEIANTYLRKGSNIYVEGSLNTKKWKDKSGNDRQTTQIIANHMIMLDRKSKDDAVWSNKDEEEMPHGTQESMEIDIDDDIPF